MEVNEPEVFADLPLPRGHGKIQEVERVAGTRELRRNGGFIVGHDVGFPGTKESPKRLAMLDESPLYGAGALLGGLAKLIC